MGGFYECLQNAKPILAIPFLLSADQPVNAQTAVDGGYGLKLTPERYTAEEVETAIGQLLTDQTFEAAARRVQRAVLSSGYGDQGPKMVESLILHGAGHLFPPAAAPGSGAAGGKRGDRGRQSAVTQWWLFGGAAVMAAAAMWLMGGQRERGGVVRVRSWR
mmetsp:Transcript_4888/g.8690  ORF Transcript_4888/g.8690 Transcript_4888/m.8690 type:complete len:161 (+) Transcript_4888:309-791(+)